MNQNDAAELFAGLSVARPDYVTALAHINGHYTASITVPKEVFEDAPLTLASFVVITENAFGATSQRVLDANGDSLIIFA